MDGPKLQSVQVPPGSVVMLSGVALGDDDGMLHQVVKQIQDTVGHEQFVLVLAPGGGAIEVWGPDVDLAVKIGELMGLGSP
jgi:hypothetical protein